MNARCQPQRRAKTKPRRKARAEQCFPVTRNRASCKVPHIRLVVAKMFRLHSSETKCQAGGARGFFFWGGGTRLKLQFLIRSISANQRPPLPTSSSTSSSGSAAVPCVLPPSVSGAGTRLPESGERREEPQRSRRGAPEEPWRSPAAAWETKNS